MAWLIWIAYWTVTAHQDCLLIHQKILTLNYLLWLVILFLPFVFHFYSDINIYISVLQDSKDERFSLLKNLPKAVSFAKKNLIARRKMLLCCQSGELTKFTYQKKILHALSFYRVETCTICEHVIIAAFFKIPASLFQRLSAHMTTKL